MSDSSLTVVGSSRRKKTYHRITDDVKSCKHQLGVDWVYAKDLWGKPLSVLVDAVEALVQRAQEECPDARIDVCLAWGGFEATGGSTQIVSPALGDPHQLVQDGQACMERLAALQKAGCRVALIGFGDKAGDSLYGLDPVYDWYAEQVNKHAKACNIMVFSLDLKLLSDQITLFATYHLSGPSSQSPGASWFCYGCCIAVADSTVRGESQAETQRRLFNGIVAFLGRSMC